MCHDRIVSETEIEAGDQAEVAVPVVWTGGEDVPVLAMNQSLVVIHEGDIVLTLGMMAPPVIRTGSAEEDIERIRQTGYVPIRTLGKFALSRRRLEELANAVQRGIEIYDRRMAEEQEPTDDD